MRKNFDMYGDSVSFDLTFNLVKDHHDSGRKWKLGCFLGLSASKHILPFALVATLFDSKEVFVRIFKTFFTAVNGQPKVIITDE